VLQHRRKAPAGGSYECPSSRPGAGLRPGRRGMARALLTQAGPDAAERAELAEPVPLAMLWSWSR